MPPFHSRSTGAFRIAVISSFGVIDSTLSSSPSALRTSGEIAMVLAARGNTPPPTEIIDLS